MKIAIVCYASVGAVASWPQSWPSAWSIVATKSMSSALIRRSDRRIQDRPGLPSRGDACAPAVSGAIPFLSLSNAIVQLSRELTFDLVHAHYAIPHATAAYLARQILSSTSGAHVPKIITTLHGTDITLLGSDRSASETVAFSIDRSDGVTAVSES